MKPTQDFTSQNLFWMKGRKVAESIKKHAPTTKTGWLDLAKATEDKIARGTFRFTGLFASEASGKPALSTSSPADALVLRKINGNIRRAYGIRQAQRAQSVKLARIALAEGTPKGVISLDLKSCFESITPRKVTEKLREDAKVSTQTIHLLEQFLSQAKKFGTNKYTRGLPRGILVSSTLAELYLKELDERIARMDGVYLYIRYVDDILVIAARPSRQALEEISGIITDLGLLLNAAKSRAVDAACQCAFECSHKIGKCPCHPKCKCERTPDNFEFVDYLGYRLIFTTGCKLKEQTCYAMIAQSKAQRTKQRVAAAITNFKKTSDYLLLHDSLKYLTSNVTIDKTLRRSILSSGIAYTYDQYEEPSDGPGRFSGCSLSSLDTFLRTRLRTLFSTTHLSYMQRRSLLRNSFVYGHKNKHRASFTRARALEIRRTWSRA
ncbi:antiviral reverse transcriptase Drt3a [Lysobacter sp. Root983]|uniref:antiviral reverse transcriptase Drt3a n=1 Tax=Lysobacter sp. Root983 TaxID=1736613 RepID=UPI0009EA1ECB|nr:antiviral reverse transcriptase Drt3a [Lysobacter sp. Root983]